MSFLKNDFSFAKNQEYFRNFFLILQQIKCFKLISAFTKRSKELLYNLSKLEVKIIANINIKKIKSIFLNSKTYPSLNNIWEGIEWKF